MIEELEDMLKICKDDEMTPDKIEEFNTHAKKAKEKLRSKYLEKDIGIRLEFVYGSFNAKQYEKAITENEKLYKEAADRIDRIVDTFNYLL